MADVEKPLADVKLVDLQGERGPAGDASRGERGDTGERGVQGERGPKGDPGDSGGQSTQGEQGEQGEQGATGKPGWKGFIGYLFLVAAFVLTGLGFYQLTDKLESQALAYCREIESIKTEGRIEGRRDFKRLPADLKLLRLEKTEEIVKVATAIRDQKLKRYAANSCPRKETPS